MNSLARIIVPSVMSIFAITGMINYWGHKHLEDISKYEFSEYIEDEFVEFKTEKHFWNDNVNSLVIIKNNNSGVRFVDRNNDLIVDEFYIKLPGKDVKKISRWGDINEEDIETIIRGQYIFQDYLEEIRMIKELNMRKKEHKEDDSPYYFDYDSTKLS